MVRFLEGDGKGADLPWFGGTDVYRLCILTVGEGRAGICLGSLLGQGIASQTQIHLDLDGVLKAALVGHMVGVVVG